MIDKIEVNLDFHIFDILDFDLLLGFPLEKHIASQGSLDVTLRKTASATAMLRKFYGEAFSRAKPAQGNNA